MPNDQTGAEKAGGETAGATARLACGHDSVAPPVARGVQRVRRAVLAVDVVESVRLIEQDEEGVIVRWLSLVDHIEASLIPSHGGRLVKCLGDGLLLEFEDSRTAVSMALGIQHASKRQNFGLPPERQMLLRMGIEAGEVIVEARDVYGHGVNLATRLAGLAGPGEIVVSARVRDRITPDIDADVEDLGDCFLKHVAQLVRAYRVGPPGPRPVIAPGFSQEELLPTLAVIPFDARDVAPEHGALGEILVEEVIGDLSRSPALNVISRLSTTALRGRLTTVAEIGAHLNADYVLSGVYRVDNRRIRLDVELAETRSAHVVWTQRLEGQIVGILDGDQELIGRVVAEVSRAVISRELRRARSQPLPTLKSYTLLMSAISLMHGTSREGFEQARIMLQTLVDRATRQSVPQAWLANWHVLRVQQGWSANPAEDAQLALSCTKRALDTDPESSLALAIDGFVHTNLLKRLDVAEERYQLAIETNPSNALAWLLKGTLHAFMSHGGQAVDDTQRALRLSPLDPHRYFYQSLAATACLADHRYESAIELAQHSLRANCRHTSTLRAKAIAEWQLGRHDEARVTVRELLRLEPDLTVSRYLRRVPAAPFTTGREWSAALRGAGVPE